MTDTFPNRDAVDDRIKELEEGLRAVVDLADAGLIDEACDHARGLLNQDEEGE